MKSPGSAAQFAEPGTVIRVVQAAERAGFDALAMTDHPAPSRKWLDNGGHTGFDPLAALSFCAAVTARIRLMTYLLVLPYRNPLLTARSIATADRLSGGRLDVVAGPGYLRSEFAALGVDHAERSALFDEALDVLRRVFEDPEFRYEGLNFTAHGTTIEPGPVQRPHPPLWIGGNGDRARARAAKLGHGWSPVQMDPSRLGTTGSVAMTTDHDIQRAVADLRRRTAEVGRPADAVAVQLEALGANDVTADPIAVRDRAAELAAIGIDRLVVNAPADPDRAVAAIEAFGEIVVAAG
ncbi:LLM class F420-dependent oxidoreductase [Rhodococcus koreensis]